ncbi:MAG: hypothetical protein Q7P63_17170 [Verrucomicrobiota bacterium JB022]|nr:hypothetical protein [Verrucomicrobiota bacterium JB022]
MDKTIEVAVILVYLLFLLGIGFSFRKLDRDASDYFRSGCRGTWWLVGTSVFMSGISAITFTSNGGVAYAAGLSYLVIYLGNVIAFVINALWLAPWFRQLRAITFPEVVRMRYGASAQQIYAYVGLVVFLLGAGIQLWALALFSSTIFGLPILWVIIGIGAVVMIYSTTGGSWAVMGTDFVQGLMMLPMTALIAVLCIQEVGGLGLFIERLGDPALHGDYQLLKPQGHELAGKFGLPWIGAMLLFQIMTQCSLNSAQRYFSVKDGKEARWSAWLAAGLMAMGTLCWIIPPITGRMLFADQIATLPLNNPAEGAYAFVSTRLLPNGLAGMIVVAMFAATMSSMDTGINRNAAMVVRDVLPALRRLTGLKPIPPEAEVKIGRATSIFFGCLIIGISCYFAGASGHGIFEVAFRIGAVIGGPLTVPLVLGIFVRRVPRWSVFVAVGCATLPSLVELYRTTALGLPAFSWPTITFLVYGLGALGFLATRPFARRMTPAYREQVDEFYTRMHRPIDFAREVGEANDDFQLRILGRFALAVGGFVTLLVFLPNPLSARFMIVGIAAFVAAVGGFMMWRASKR